MKERSEGSDAITAVIRGDSSARPPSYSSRYSATHVRSRGRGRDGVSTLRLVSGRIGISTHEYTSVSASRHGTHSAILKELSMTQARRLAVAGVLVASIVALGLGEAALRASVSPAA